MSGDTRAALESALTGRYAIERELGRGGMATVYLARDLRHDRPVALKVLHPELAASLGAERFLREIRLAARLQHPHILTVLDSGEIPVSGAPPILWFTMPFIRGESLRDRLSREKQLPVEDALRIAREAADALGYAHDEGIIHRDIKPENILISGSRERGGAGSGHALVADFGIARALGASDDKLTETGLTVGTPAYMSPEQASGQRDLDARTDIYSLGIVLYEMLAGETPFAAPTAQAMIARRFMEAPKPVRQVREAVPEAIEAALQKALARTAADRFGSAAEFAAALTPTAVATPTTRAPAATAPSVSAAPSAPDTARFPAGKGTRRGLPVAAASLTLGFVLGLGLLFGWLRKHGSEAPDEKGPKLLAVLPFQNLGDSIDEYFADGITDEVRGKLASLSGLKVIAGSSAGQYRHTDKSPQQIAKELGVPYLLIGKIRWEKQPGGASRVRVSPELVQVVEGSAPTTKWQRAFEASMTDVFQVQADIAARVAQALDLALADSTQEQLAEKPTSNLAAYDAYLRGMEALNRGGSPVTLRQALEQFEQAVALDTAFAPAWARLSQAASFMLAVGAPAPGLKGRSLAAANRALALGPNLPEAHVALGDYYRRIEGDFERALQAYEAGERPGAPDAALLRARGLAEETLGRWDAAYEHERQAYTLDPRSPLTALVFAATLARLRKPEALDVARHAVSLGPTNLQALQTLTLVYLGQGDLEGARAATRTLPPGVEPTALIAYLATFNDLYWVLTPEQQNLLLRLPPSAFDDDRGAWGLALAGVYWLRGDRGRTRAYGDSAVSAMGEQVKASPDDGQLHVLLGTALAYAGLKAQAIEEGRRGVALAPIERNATLGPYVLLQLARIYIVTGEDEKAIDCLEQVLRATYIVTPAWLRIDPTFDPLRKNPRFQKLVEGST